MTNINPLANALPQSFSTQQQMLADKTRQARQRRFRPSSVIADEAEQFEHPIERPEEAAPIHEHATQRGLSPGGGHGHSNDNSPDDDDEPEHIDLKA